MKQIIKVEPQFLWKKKVYFLR